MNRQTGLSIGYKLPALLGFLILTNLASHSEDFDLFVAAECEECEQALSDIGLVPSGLWMFPFEKAKIIANFLGDGDAGWSMGPEPGGIIVVAGPSTPLGRSTEFEVTALGLSEESMAIAWGDHESTSFPVIARDSEGNRTSRQAVVHVTKPNVILANNTAAQCGSNCVSDDLPELVTEMRLIGVDSNSSWTFTNVFEIGTSVQSSLIKDIKVAHTSGITADLSIDFWGDYPANCVAKIINNEGHTIGCRTAIRIEYKPNTGGVQHFRVKVKRIHMLY